MAGRISRTLAVAAAAFTVAVATGMASERVLRVIETNDQSPTGQWIRPWNARVAHFEGAVTNAARDQALAEAQKNAAQHTFYVYTVPEMDQKIADIQKDVADRSMVHSDQMDKLRMDIIGEIGRLPTSMLSEEIKKDLETRLLSAIAADYAEREKRLRTDLTKEIMGQVAAMLDERLKHSP